MPNIKVQSNDKKVFTFDVEAAKKSKTLRTMMEDLGIDEDEVEVIPLPNVNSTIMVKVIEWCNHYKSVEYVDDDALDRGTMDLGEWDAKFLQVDQPILLEILLAANYLDIKDLLDASCLAVAKMIRGRTPEDIRTIFNIKNDHLAEDEEETSFEEI